jgi:hypothetical protein
MLNDKDVALSLHSGVIGLLDLNEISKKLSEIPYVA